MRHHSFACVRILFAVNGKVVFMKPLIQKIKCAVFGHPASKRERDPSLDNIRFLLIFFVVFAHFLEICKPFIETGIDYGGGLIYGSGVIYKTLYSFHMPAFIFLFGYHARYAPKRIVFRWIIPYFVFQTLYILFSNHVLSVNLEFQYTTPYWILWFLLACIFYQLILPLYDVKRIYGEIITLVASFAIALLAGYDKTVGYYLSLSRFLVFLPWFVMGYYCQKHGILEKLHTKRAWRWSITAVSAILAGLSVLYLYKAYTKNALLYGSYSYASIGCTAWARAFICLISLVWICFLFVGIKPLLRFKIPLITMIGQNTLPVFLVHGFIVKAAPLYFQEFLNTPWGVLLLTCAILVLSGNPLLRWLVDAVSLSWLEKFAEPKRSEPGE